MLNDKWRIMSILICFFISACVYTNKSTKDSSFPDQTTDCSRKLEQRAVLTESLQNKVDSLDRKNRELVSLNAYLEHKTNKLEMELLKRQAVIQVQGNVIKLLDDAEKTIETGLKDEIDEKINELKKALRKATGVFSSHELFAPKTFTMTNQGKEKLRTFIDSIKNNKDHMIFVEGHTDNVPVSNALKKRYPSNWEISVARSAAVARFLQTLPGIKPERLVVTGHGPYKPIDTNQTQEGRQRNRRVEIILGPPL